MLPLPPPPPLRLPADRLSGMALGAAEAAGAAAPVPDCAAASAAGADCSGAVGASAAALPSASRLLLISRPPMAEKTSSSLAHFAIAARCCSALHVQQGNRNSAAHSCPHPHHLHALTSRLAMCCAKMSNITGTSSAPAGACLQWAASRVDSRAHRRAGAGCWSWRALLSNAICLSQQHHVSASQNSCAWPIGCAVRPASEPAWQRSSNGSLHARLHVINMCMRTWQLEALLERGAEVLQLAAAEAARGAAAGLGARRVLVKRHALRHKAGNRLVSAGRPRCGGQRHVLVLGAQACTGDQRTLNSA